MTTPDARRPSSHYVTDEYGNVMWGVAATEDDCPLCAHPLEKHSDLGGCEEQEGYDHINGFHECACPLMPLAWDEVFRKGSSDA